MYVEPGISNSTGKRKTVRVIGENFSEILIKGRKLVRVLDEHQLSEFLLSRLHCM